MSWGHRQVGSVIVPVQGPHLVSRGKQGVDSKSRAGDPSREGFSAELVQGLLVAEFSQAFRPH